MATEKEPVPVKRVRALETGFDNLAIREPGDIFNMPADASAPWFEDVDEPAPKKGGKKDDPLV
jgi:hypothetical protein